MRYTFILLALLCSSNVLVGQSLAELEKQLDSLLRKRERSELIIGLGFGNNPAYGGKTANFDRPIVMKQFLSPSVAYYHKSGFYGGASTYYLLNANGRPWFEWDLTAGYDYTKNKDFLTGISYTRYFFTDSSDVPSTPITNELFAYFYYRGWWLQPGISVDFGWGRETELVKLQRTSFTRTISGRDFNVIAALRHPFVFLDVVTENDALLITPSIGFTMGTANYYSNLKGFQYISRSPKMKKDAHRRRRRFPDEINTSAHTAFEPRAVDLTLNVSYMLGKITLSPSYTLFRPFQGEDKSLMGYFTARVSLTL